ncbi:MAG: DUF4331 family protein [Chromatiales bacterium]|nr:DUF4331 family protein [Chromatiales bacterium]
MSNALGRLITAFNPSKIGVLRTMLAATLVLFNASSPAADHGDSPLVRADPAADFGDVLAWMSPDASKLYLLASVVRNATADSRFSDAVQYVFHTRSSASFGATEADPVNVICTFEGADEQTISCWAGDESYVSGNADDPSGLSSDDGKIRVFAGLRNDAFYFNSKGFNATRTAVRDAAPSLSFDAAGCPTLDTATSNALVGLLTSTDGGPAQDAFGNANILVLALEVDKSIVTTGGPIVAVWGSTRVRP